MDFTTIHSDFNLTEAQLVCARLEAAGFHPFVAGENTAGWFGDGTWPPFPVRVQVPETEARDAKEFLAAPNPDAP
jgi:hypothetical protein